MNPSNHHYHATFWMVVTGFLAVSINTLMRTLIDVFHPFQLVWFYNVFGLILLMPLLWRQKVSLSTTRLPLFITRSVFEFIGFSLSFFALAQLPLPTHTALSFTSPLFASVFAVFLLREHSSIHRWLALTVGFCGVLVVTNPYQGEMETGMLIMLAGACVFALCGISIKKLTLTEPPLRMAFYMMFLTALVASPFCFWEWRPIPISVLPHLLILGALVVAVQYSVSRALSLGEMTALLPLTFLNLIWSSLYAWILFHDIIAMPVLIGGGLIVFAAFYIARFGHRPARLSDVVQA